MLKCEKYATQIAKGLAYDEHCDFIKKYILKKDNCIGTTCSECEAKTARWMLEEYEPEIDWSKVPVDTPVMVRDTVNKKWSERHFVCYMPSDNYPFLAFSYGDKRETANGVDKWKYCKLAEGVDPTPFLKEV